MKNQQFRYRLIALLLVGLIALAGFHGTRTIPPTGSDSSLRDAVLRLTGQAAPAATDASDASETPAAEAVTESAPAAESATPSLPDALGQILFPTTTVTVSPEPTPTAQADSDPTPAPPLSEALSNYFGSPAPSAAETPSAIP